jgi:hypothetical protein
MDAFGLRSRQFTGSSELRNGMFSSTDSDGLVLEMTVSAILKKASSIL